MILNYGAKFKLQDVQNRIGVDKLPREGGRCHVNILGLIHLPFALEAVKVDVYERFSKNVRTVMAQTGRELS